MESQIKLDDKNIYIYIYLSYMGEHCFQKFGSRLFAMSSASGSVGGEILQEFGSSFLAHGIVY